MATKKNASKVTKRAEVNIPAILNAKESRLKKQTKSKSKKVAKELKNLSAKSILIALLFLVIGSGIGVSGWFFVCRNDKFDLIGQDELSLTLDETYADQGVKIIAFGKDDSKNVTIETNLKQNIDGELYAEEAGTYFIKYTTSNFKYGKLFKIQKIRLITFEEVGESMNQEEDVGNE